VTRPLDVRVREQAEQCRPHSPLTAALLSGAADELGAPGPVRDLLAPLAGDPPGSVPALRFAGALHRLVLERQAPALALHYPSVGGTAGVEGAWAAAREVVRDEPRLHELVRRPVQTNEVGRSAALYGGLLHVVARTGLPVRLLEVGASAGLNLRVDAFAYEVGDRVLGDPASPVRLRQPWQGTPPPQADLVVAQRSGCDPEPLDPGSTADRLTLTSYVWADQVERLERLRGALRVAEQVPASVEALPASAFLARELATPVPGVVTVVWHSVVWQYLDPQDREALRELLADAGARATREAPLALLSHEPERVGSSGFRFSVALSSWPGAQVSGAQVSGAQVEVLAEAQGHGPPVVWGRRTS